MSAPAQPLWSRAPAETIRAWLARLAPLVLLALLLWASQFTPQLGVAEPPDDGSYQSAMDHFLATGARCGIDWVYTYGPLGACQALTYHPDVVWTKLLVWELLFKGCLALALVRALWRAAEPFQRVVPYLALVFAPSWGDGYTFAGMLACVDLALERPESRVRTLGALVVLGLAALSKNTALFLAAPVVLALVVVRWRVLGVQAALGFAAAFVALWCGVWIACGQLLRDIPLFLARSFELASAYNAGLADEAPAGIDALALTTFASALACAFVVHWVSARPLVSLARALVHAAFLFVVFKAGLVRASDHVAIFTFFASIALFLGAPLAELVPGPRRALAFSLRWGTFVVLVPLSFWLSGFAHDTCGGVAYRLGNTLDVAWDFLRAPRAHVAAADKDHTFVKKLRALPLSTHAIGRATVDVFPPFQDLVLMNDFEWRPRPVFQPYAVLSRDLERINADFLASERAPEFFFLRFFPMDGNLPSMEDAETLTVLARDYVPVLQEQGYLLLRREPASARALVREVVFDERVRFGERIDVASLGGGCLLLELEAEPTFGGRVRSTILRPAAMFADVEFVSGLTRYVRVVPQMLAGGAILNPWIDTTEDWLRWQGGTGTRVAAITFAPPVVRDFWRDDLRVRIVRAKDLAPRPEARARARQLLSEYPMFTTSPVRVQLATPPQTVEVDGELVLEVGANAALYYDVAPGKHRVRGGYGLVQTAHSVSASDGVRFQVHVRDESGRSRTLLRVYVDPRKHPEQRRVQDFEFEFECATASQVVFHTLPGPAGDNTDDRAYWTRLAVE